MRTYQHIIDTKAVRQVINSIPEYSVVRELTERDYGIDLMIELFSKVGENKHGHELFDSTGHVCYLQIKGTDKEFVINEDETISYNIDKKSLYYVEKFSTPFILTRVCTEKGKEAIYFIWLQRYISDILDIERPEWRTDENDSLTIYIPIHNNFIDNFVKVEKIAYRIKLIEELSEYSEKYSEIKMALQTILKLQDKFEHFIDVIKGLKRLSQLTTLLTKNNCCVDKACLLELIEYLKGVRNGNNSPTQMEEYPHNFNMELLRTSNLSTRFVEEMEADNEGVTTY
jgi:hypothetical protein